MKKWILEHKKLYFFIVGVVAFIAFMAITLIGCCKISKAATDSVWFSVDGNSIPDITSLDWSEYTEYFEREYGYTGNIGEKILRDHKYCVVVINPYYWPNEVPWVSFLFTNAPYVYEANDLNCIFPDFDTSFSFEYRDGQIQYPRGYGMNAWDNSKFPDYPDNSIPFVVTSNNISSQVIASSYDIGNEWGLKHSSFTLVDYPTVEYDILHGLERHVENVVFTEILSDGVSKWQVSYDTIPDIQFPLPDTYSLYSMHRFRVPPLLYLEFLKGEEILESDVSEWRASGTYFVEFDFTLESSYSGNLNLYEALRSALVSQWFDIYGVELDNELLDIALRYAYPHVSILRPLQNVDGVLYGGNANICYAQSIYMGYDDNLEIILFKDISGCGFDDILDMASDSLYEDTDALKTQLENALIELEEKKVALAETQKKLEELREEYDAYLKSSSLSGFLDFFTDIAKSFESAAESVGAIGHGIADVFSFLPIEIRVGLYFALPFLIFVAIYKAIKS